MNTDDWRRDIDDLLLSIKHDASRLFQHPVYKSYAQAGAAYIKLREAEMWLKDIKLPVEYK